MADSDVGKLFIGGISRDTTDATLKDYFTKYGDVSSSNVAKDRVTGIPRGFGFVTFANPSSVDNVLRNDHHFIAGKTVEVKRAFPRNGLQSIAQQQPGNNVHHTNKGYVRNINGSQGANNTDECLRAKKIFVGGLSPNLTEEEFKTYFEKFGKIVDVVVMHDNTTNRPRGFGFITFDSEEAVEKLMQNSHHELGGKRVEVKRAVPKEATRNSNNGNNSRFGSSRFFPIPNPDNNSWPRGAYMNYPGQFPLSTPYPGYYYDGGYSNGYPLVGYGVCGYEMPVVPPSTLWNGSGMMGVQPLPYGTGFYPTVVNGGVAFLGMINGYNGFVDNHAREYTKPDEDHQVNGTVSSEVDVSSAQNCRVSEAQEQLKLPPVVSPASSMGR
ncbi:unnamed protein product [Amaranthus hypochondriacus]